MDKKRCFINISIIVTGVALCYSLHKATSNHPDFTLLALFLSNLAYVSMLFIFKLTCTAFSAGHIKNKNILKYASIVKTGAIRQSVVSCHHAFYAEHNGITIAIHEKLMSGYILGYQNKI